MKAAEKSAGIWNGSALSGFEDEGKNDIKKSLCVYGRASAPAMKAPKWRHQMVSAFSFEVSATVDDSGFVVLVCPGSYVGFISNDWTLAELLSRFVEQMGAGSLFVAYPGPDLANESLRIASKASVQSCLREVTGVVSVGEAGLWLTDYSTLTMAAQFSDEPPISSWHVQLPVPPGTFRIVLRQFANSWEQEMRPAIELLVLPLNEKEQIVRHEAVPWFV
jgi:hypothetical protein